MRDQDLIWPFTTKSILKRWNEDVSKGGADDPKREATEIVCLLLDEIARLRKLVKSAKARHYEDSDFLCAEIMRLRDAIRWLKANLGGGKDYVEKAFKAIGPKHEKEMNKLLDKKRKKERKAKK